MAEMEDIEVLEKGLYVQIHVEAEDEDDRCYCWKARVPCGRPLLPLRAQWAEAHGVTEAAVGFEDYLDREVDLQKTPQELGWTCKAPVFLHAVPVDDRFAEGAEGELPAKASKPEAKAEAKEVKKQVAEEAPARASKLEARLEARKQATVASAKTEPSEATAAPAAKRQRTAQTAAAPAALPSAYAPAAAPASPPVPSAPAAAAPDEGAPASGSAPAAPAKAAEAPIAAAFNRQARENPEPAEQATGSMKFAPLASFTATIDLDDEPDDVPGSAGAGCSSSSSPADAPGDGGAGGAKADAEPPAATTTAETAAAPLRKRGRPGLGEAPRSKGEEGEAPRRKGEEGACPLGSEAVAFDARNPKKAGTGAYERYGKYKEAKTAAEALRLGASKADLLHDYKKGFMRRC